MCSAWISLGQEWVIWPLLGPSSIAVTVGSWHVGTPSLPTAIPSIAEVDPPPQAFFWLFPVFFVMGDWASVRYVRQCRSITCSTWDLGKKEVAGFCCALLRCLRCHLLVWPPRAGCGIWCDWWYGCNLSQPFLIHIKRLFKVTCISRCSLSSPVGFFWSNLGLAEPPFENYKVL